jgi:hypothetical protein
VKRKLLFILVALLVVLLLVGVALMLRQSAARRELLAYKSQLQAQGELLTWADLGYPRDPETNDCINQLKLALQKIGKQKLEPGTLKIMSFDPDGSIQPIWASPNPAWYDFADTNLTWTDFDREMQAFQPVFVEMREALRDPPLRCIADPTNYAVRPAFEFLTQRNAAQWLALQVIYAMREQNLSLARDSLLTLRQMVRLHEKDPIFVSQIIRTAILGLALNATWEALQAPGWSEADLAIIQDAWSDINLVQRLELGLTGERATSTAFFSHVRAKSHATRGQSVLQVIGSGNNPTRDWEYYWQHFVVLPYWAAHMEADELLSLRHQQKCLQEIRQLGLGRSWREVDSALQSHQDEFDEVLRSPLGRVRYLLSGLIVANVNRAALTAVRTETLRRLTVTAIAIKRYELKSQQAPPDLAALVPEFLAAEPIDPMSGGPMRYRVTESGWVLYSVGEDGVDNNGDASLADPATPAKDRGIWSGRDFVWPDPPKSRP